ncbi:MAG: glycosyltransferase family 2 protein [Cyclobacteriaceae bacterium]
MMIGDRGRVAFSIVTPSYNQGNFLEETICSVLDQGYPNLEYVIIDGGSNDNSVQIIKKYERHLKHWVSEPDNGQSHAINKGIAHATGNIVNWINSDDVMFPGSLKLIAKRFEENPDVDIVTGRELRFKINSEWLHPGSTIHKNQARTVMAAHCVQPQTFFRKWIFDYFHGVNENYNYLMDAELWVKYLLLFGQSKVMKTNDYYTKFRVHENSKTSTAVEKFKKERRALSYSIGCTADLPKFVLDRCISEELFEPDHNLRLQITENSETKVKADLKNGIKALFALHWFEDYYHIGKFKYSRILFKQAILYGRMLPKIRLVKLALKLWLLPSFVIEHFRRSQRI